MLKQFSARGNLRLLRYSPCEQYVDSFAGADYIIRFSKDPDEFCKWTGNINSPIAIYGNIALRDSLTRDFFNLICDTQPVQLYGHGNNYLAYNDMKKALQNHKCFININSSPASYTMSFIEAWMTGIPVIIPGYKYGHSMNVHGNPKMYELPELISNEENGIISDDIKVLSSYITKFLNDDKFASSISSAGRNTAMQYFDNKVTLPQWQEVFKNL